MAKYTLVCVRHGESEWNQKNLFCGWHDADLSATGVEEAKNAGKVRGQSFLFLPVLPFKQNPDQLLSVCPFFCLFVCLLFSVCLSVRL